MNVAHHQRHKAVGCARRFAAGLVLDSRALETQNAKGSPPRGKIRLGNLLHALQCHVFILRCSRVLSAFRPRAARYIDRVTNNLIWITLLVKLGVVASVASVLARVTTFRRSFFAERRSRRQTLALLAFFLVPLTLGVWLRFWVPNFLAADISFETVILLGLLIGPGWAMLSGAVLSVPAFLHHEFLALPFNVILGLAAGMIGRFVEKEEIWSFTPFIDLSLYRWIRRNLIKPRIDRQILLLVLIAVMEMIRDWIAHLFPHRLFALLADQTLAAGAGLARAPINVGIALKVWNALRVEMSLEEQKRLLLEARLDALQRQINPHFLFNTLNSVASLVRSQPELARQMTVKLANILRALLKDHDAYVPLREELKFTDDYLDIEVVRFGADKLRVEKEIDPRTLGVLVPSILLQPLIENSIKHGLEPRIRGGTVTLRSRLEGDRISIEVADDGVGMSAQPSAAIRRAGAGHRHEECAGAAGGSLRQPGPLQRGQQPRPRHGRLHRDSGQLAGLARGVSDSIWPEEAEMSGREAAATGPVHLGEIGQIAVTVSDLGRSKDFYQNVLGMQFLFDAGPMAFFQCGKIRFAIGTSKKPVSPSGTILYFRVADIQSIHAALAAKGVAFVQEPHQVARMAGHDLWLAFLRDPDGNPIGLMCELPHDPPAAA